VSVPTNIVERRYDELVRGLQIDAITSEAEA
jgi:hypothetical protein